MNPWEQTVLNRCRSCLRFTLWLCLVLNGFMAGVFSVWFTLMFLRHLGSYLARTMFSSPW